MRLTGDHFSPSAYWRLILVGILVAGMGAGCREQASPQRPNFIFILVDDLGARDLGVYGSTFHETPALDRFAGSGMLFTSAYAASPVCSPTRAAIMTGKHPARIEITDWIPGDRPQDRPLLGPPIRNELPLEETTIAEVLQQAGYRTFFAGKWHLGGPGYYPEQHGFDSNLGGIEAGSPPGGYYSPYRNPTLPDGPEGEYLTDRLTDESIRFLEGGDERPFALFLWYYTVHTPIQASRHVGRFEAKLETLAANLQPDQISEAGAWTKTRQDDPAYASMVYAMDENVGRLLDALEQGGLAGFTHVIFTSDNGGRSTLQGRPGGPTSNLPLRAGKGWAYEGGIRVPLIIRSPGLTAPGSTSSHMVTSTDFYPTLVELAGLSLPEGSAPDGVSLIPALQGSVTGREELFWHFPHYHGSGWTPGGAIRSGDWKLLEYFEGNRLELYHLADDPGEVTDLAGRHPERAERMRQRLGEWRARVGAKMPGPNPAAADVLQPETRVQ